MVTVLCKSNDSEFRRISTKFYEILRKSAKFRGERIFGEISLASIVSPLTKFRADVRNFTWQIRWRWQNSFEISSVGAKFQTKFRKWVRNFKLNFQHFVCVSEISNENLVWRSKFRSPFVVITQGSQNAECKLREKKKTVHWWESVLKDIHSHAVLSPRF